MQRKGHRATPPPLSDLVLDALGRGRFYAIDGETNALKFEVLCEHGRGNAKKSIPLPVAPTVHGQRHRCIAQPVLAEALKPNNAALHVL
jgi:hypothetical protein